MAFLDETGLASLIQKIQSDVIQSKTYTDIIAAGADYGIGLLKIKSKNSTEPWIVKYRVSAEIPTDGNSKQIAEIVLGGFGETLSFYQSKNIVYDTGRCAVPDSLVARSKYGSDDVIVGVYSGIRHLEPQTVTIEIQGTYGCQVVFCGSPIISIFRDYNITRIDFDKNGIVESQDQAYVTKQELAPVAFSNSYEDLFNKPDLLGVVSDEDEENLIFFY